MMLEQTATQNAQREENGLCLNYLHIYVLASEFIDINRYCNAMDQSYNSKASCEATFSLTNVKGYQGYLKE